MRYFLATLCVLSAGPAFADDFVDRVAALEAKNAAVAKPAVAPCRCSVPCPCAGCEWCGDATCPRAPSIPPKDGQKCKADDGGADWTYTAGYGWWRYARPAAPPAYFRTAPAFFGGSCGPRG